MIFFLFYSDITMWTLLEKNNFTIDSSTWEIQDANGIVNGQHVSLKVKVHPEWDVWEYVAWVPATFVGQQLFTYRAALRELQRVWKSLPSDISALEAAIASMSGETDIQRYQQYLETAGIRFTGCFSFESHVFDDIGTWSYYRLEDGTRVALSPATWNIARRDESMGYMISFAE